VRDLSEFADADIIVGADGVSSLVRRSDEAAFGARVSYLTNRFAWYGTTKVFETLSQTFLETGHGPINAHHYRFSPTMSTFLVECSEKTFFAAGFDRMTEDQTRVALERIFAKTLDGHRLVSNRSIWRQFPVIHNERWSVGNRVILGDALHTAHFSIGSGHAAGVRGRHRSRPRDPQRSARCSSGARSLSGAAQADPRQARHRSQCQRAMVRAFRCAHGAGALRPRDVVPVADGADGYRAHPQGCAEIRVGVGAAQTDVTIIPGRDRRPRARNP
jgi:hypothetical protein